MNSASARSCVFCGSASLRLNRAHVVALSFLDELPTVDGGFRRMEVWRDPCDGELQYGEYEANKDPRETYGRVTCHDCNGLWMGPLEDSAKNHVVKLANGTPVSLSAQDQSSISAWAAAAGVVRGKLEKAPHFVDEDAQHMYKEGLPEGFRVWLVMGDRRDDIPTRHSRLLTTAGAGWIGWIWMGHTVFVMASNAAAEALSLNLMGINPVVQQIHPVEDSNVEWPPYPVEFDVGVRYEKFVSITTL